jgi:hypothetical protein
VGTYEFTGSAIWSELIYTPRVRRALDNNAITGIPDDTFDGNTNLTQLWVNSLEASLELDPSYFYPSPLQTSL